MQADARHQNMSLLLFLTVCISSVHGAPDRWSGQWKGPPRSVPSQSSVGGPLLGNGEVGLTWGSSEGKTTMYVGANSFWFLRNNSDRDINKQSFILPIGGVTLTATNQVTGKMLKGVAFEQNIARGHVSWNLTLVSPLDSCGPKIIGEWVIEGSARNVLLQRKPGAASDTFFWNNTLGWRYEGWKIANGTVNATSITLDYNRIESAGCEPPACGPPAPNGGGCVCRFHGAFEGDCDHFVINYQHWHRKGLPPVSDPHDRADMRRNKSAPPDTTVYLSGVTTMSQHSTKNTAQVITQLSATAPADIRVNVSTWAYSSQQAPARVVTHPVGAVGVGRDAKGDLLPVSAAIATVLAPGSPTSQGAPSIAQSSSCDGTSCAASQMCAACQAATIAFTVAGMHNGQASTVTLVHSVTTNYSASQAPLAERERIYQDPLEMALSDVHEAGKNTSAISASSTTFWKRFWSASSVSLPDHPLVEAYWWRSQYILATSSRPGHTAPGLWGPFITTDASLWHGDYTLNYNMQGPFYGVLSSNHPDLLLPYIEQILAAVQATGTADAASYGCHDGAIHLPGHFAPGGRVNYGDMHQHTDASFAALHFVNYFKYTRNQTFLREVSFPLLRGIAAWWTCWLTKVPKPVGSMPSGELHGQYTWQDLTDCTRENCNPNAASYLQNSESGAPTSRNPASALSFIRFILTQLVEVAEEGLVEPVPWELARWKDILTNLAPIPTAFKRGSNTTVLLPQEDPYYFAPGDNPLQLYALYPGEQIGLSSPPALLQAARDTVILSNAWGQMNSFQESFPAAVRAAVDPSVILRQMENLLASRMPPNGYVHQGGGGIETAGATIAVNEMLLQSWEGFLRFFPVWPANESASFSGLRAVGAFIVGATHSPNVELRVVNVTVLSEVGHNCTVLSPWSGGRIAVVRLYPNGSSTPVPVTPSRRSDESTVIVSTTGLWTFGTDIGSLYSIAPVQN